ncbi:MAG: hypothetical protein M1819_006306 [Sarea resinae]|nr:MAG: hypothetical protein M1819_006306 [Sarea resinae]
MASQQHLKLAQSLPPRLLRFFTRYPPAVLQSTDRLPNAASTASSSVPPAGATPPDIVEGQNPFQSHKHPITGKWHDPAFSLRRQAEMVKLAQQHGVESLLPFTVKGTEERLRKREENGLRVKGTGVGQRVKGKKWERSLKSRLEKRRQAMLEMPQLIQTWKERGHGRGWKKWPK